MLYAIHPETRKSRCEVLISRYFLDDSLNSGLCLGCDRTRMAASPSGSFSALLLAFRWKFQPSLRWSKVNSPDTPPPTQRGCKRRAPNDASTKNRESFGQLRPSLQVQRGNLRARAIPAAQVQKSEEIARTLLPGILAQRARAFRASWGRSSDSKIEVEPGFLWNELIKTTSGIVFLVRTYVGRMRC